MGNIFKRAVGAVKQAARAVDVTSKKSAIRSGLRELDDKVGGGQGWGKLTQVAGAVVAVVPGFQAAGGAIIAAGKGVQAQAAKEDAARAVKRAETAQVAAQAAGYAPTGAPVAGQVVAGSPGAPPLTFGAWLLSLVKGHP